jgi:hypothetical protein
LATAGVIFFVVGLGMGEWLLGIQKNMRRFGGACLRSGWRG